MKNAPDWSDLQLFLAVARAGGLSGAAHSTGRSAATLGRRMLTLERDLGQSLFTRHERGYALTDAGRRLVASLDVVETGMAAAIAPTSADSRPMIKLSAGSWMTLHLLSYVADLQGNPPDLMLRFVAAEEILDIRHRQIAIGFRNARPTAASLAGRRVMTVQFAAYATPDAPARWIKVAADTPSAAWVAKRAGRDAVCEVTAPRNSLDLALAGQGQAVLPTFIGDKQPGLLRQGGPIAALSHEMWMVTHQDDRHLPEVRRLINRIYQVLGVAGGRR